MLVIYFQFFSLPSQSPPRWTKEHLAKFSSSANVRQFQSMEFFSSAMPSTLDTSSGTTAKVISGGGNSIRLKWWLRVMSRIRIFICWAIVFNHAPTRSPLRQSTRRNFPNEPRIARRIYWDVGFFFQPVINLKYSSWFLFKTCGTLRQQG